MVLTPVLGFHSIEAGSNGEQIKKMQTFLEDYNTAAIDDEYNFMKAYWARVTNITDDTVKNEVRK